MGRSVWPWPWPWWWLLVCREPWDDELTCLLLLLPWSLPPPPLETAPPDASLWIASRILCTRDRACAMETSSKLKSFVRARTVAWNRFFTALSVRPGRAFVILAHWLPIARCMVMIMRSSSSVQSPFLIPGFRWLCQRSRHCLPVRSVSISAMLVQLPVPWTLINRRSFSSSDDVQGSDKAKSNNSKLDVNHSLLNPEVFPQPVYLLFFSLNSDMLSVNLLKSYQKCRQFC